MKSALRFLFFTIIVYGLITSLIGLIKTDSFVPEECEDRYELINDGYRRHERSWDFYDYSESFCTTYSTYEKQSLETGKLRNDIKLGTQDYEDLWGRVYRKLIEDSKSYIDFMVDSLQIIANNRNLSREDLAELVVAFVQDIPYSYVRSKACDQFDNQGKPCIGNVKLGILSPYEFLHSLYGDCDTRAVLIFTILEEMRFDPMVVVSNEYAHAMLALNIGATGDHLTHKGKNYYFWETTAKGWPIGMLPPNTNKVKYWKIALVGN